MKRFMQDAPESYQVTPGIDGQLLSYSLKMELECPTLCLTLLHVPWMGHGNGTCQNWSTSLSNVCIRESMRQKLGLHKRHPPVVPREPDALYSSRFPASGISMAIRFLTKRPIRFKAFKPGMRCVAHASLLDQNNASLQQHQMKWVDLTCNFLQHLHVFFGRLGSYPLGAINLPWANTTKPADSSWLRQQCSNEVWFDTSESVSSWWTRDALMFSQFWSFQLCVKRRETHSCTHQALSCFSKMLGLVSVRRLESGESSTPHDTCQRYPQALTLRKRDSSNQRSAILWLEGLGQAV